MDKEIAGLIAQKERERKVDIGRLTTYPEYYALKEEVDKVVKHLDSIDNIDSKSSIPVQVQVEAAKIAKEKFLRLFSDLGAYALKANDTLDKSYN